MPLALPAAALDSARASCVAEQDRLDLYGQRLEVRFVAKLRDEMNFESMEDLVAQMQRDEAVARRLLAEETVPD